MWLLTKNSGTQKTVNFKIKLKKHLRTAMYSEVTI